LEFGGGEVVECGLDIMLRNRRRPPRTIAIFQTALFSRLKPRQAKDGHLWSSINRETDGNKGDGAEA